MAFGKFSMVSQRAKPRKPVEKKPEPPVVKKQPKTFDKGASVLEIALVAPTCEEAEDFLCGCYFNLIQALGGSSLTAYTREFPTISRLTETKQLMEETILKPVGRELLRTTAEEEEPLSQATISVSQAGNTALAVDLHLTWTAPGALGGQADAVFALLNCAEPQAAQSLVNTVRHAAAGIPVIWILTNFENKTLFWAVDGAAAPKVQLRKELMETLNLTCAAGEYVSYAQVYGGMEFVGRKNGSALLRSDRRCREYMPMGCHVPVFVAVDAVRRFRANQGENVVPDAAVEKIWLLMQGHKDTLKGWYDGHTEKGESKS